MPIKQQFKDINWLQVLVHLAAVIAATWAVIALVGDGRWANRTATEQAIGTLNTAIQVNNVLDQKHYDDVSLHMPEQVKRAEFVSRGEWNAVNNQHAKDIATVQEDVSEVKSDQREFFAEQRRVNREVLDRLPKQP
ncbi:hypothetical protein [Cerasicoccus arenae]|nr:hypothetical protein [Cerasicoccus arenae]